MMEQGATPNACSSEIGMARSPFSYASHACIILILLANAIDNMQQNRLRGFWANVHEIRWTKHVYMRPANAAISQCRRGEREEGRYSFLIPFLTPSLNIET